MSICKDMANHLDLVRVPSVCNKRERTRKLSVAKAVLDYDESYYQSDRAENMRVIHSCGKMKALSKLLAKWKKDKLKVLIFSRSVRLLNILEMWCTFTMGYRVLRLDGGTPQSARRSLVDDFNESKGIFAFLISTHAGGMGINLQSASRVVIFDPDWNPSFDLQAQDRAYRIGQKKKVEVYRLLSRGTIEEVIYLRQVYKQQMAKSVEEGTTTARYYTGFKGGGKSNHGDLWGAKNLLQYTEEGFTDKIMHRHREMTSSFKKTGEIGFTIDKDGLAMQAAAKQSSSRISGTATVEESASSSAENAGDNTVSEKDRADFLANICGIKGPITNDYLTRHDDDESKIVGLACSLKTQVVSPDT